MNKSSITLALTLLASTAHAQELTSRTALETILDDQILLEEFESISLHSGSTFPVPNPLNETTAMSVGWGFEILPWINFHATNELNLFGGFIGGTEDVYLRANGDLTISFDEPQIAVGMDIYSQSESITVYSRNNQLLEQFDSPSTGFFGYHAPNQGISSIVIVSQSANTSVNDVAYGAIFTPCPADLTNDAVHDFFDVSLFLTYFAQEDDRADLTDDGNYDFFDVSIFLQNFAIACP